MGAANNMKLDFDLVRTRAKSKDAITEAERIRDLLLSYSQDWKRQELEDVDYSKLNRNIYFQDMLQGRISSLKKALNYVSLQCPNFIRHVRRFHPIY